MKEIYPASLESLEKVRERAEIFKKDLKICLSENPNWKRIGIVGHNMSFRVLTATDKYWKLKKAEPLEPPYCLNLKNCELALFDL
jgi:hypothetical protein